MPLYAKVTGVINGGAGDTFQTGDTINGSGSTNRVDVTIAAANGGSLVAVNNVDAVNFRTLAAGQTINAQLFTGVNTVRSTGSNSVLTVANGAIASTYALENTISRTADGLAVGIRAGDTTGTSTTANFSVANVGSPLIPSTAGNTAAVPSALSTTVTGIENIAIATSGTNVFQFTGNTTATTDSVLLTITGAGNNTVTIGAGGLATTSTITAATATGSLNLNVGANLSSNDTVIGTGGTSDTLRATVDGVVATGVTATGFETFRIDTGANIAVIGFAANPGFTTVREDFAIVTGLNRTLVNGGGFSTLSLVGDALTANAAVAQFYSGITTTGGWTGAADTLAVNVSNGGVTLTAATPAVTLGAVAGAGANFLNLAGVENINLTINDVTATTEQSAIGIIQGSTLSSVAITSAGNVNFNLSDGADIDSVVNSNSISSINLSGVTGVAGGATTMQIGGTVANILAPALTITAGAAGLTAVLAQAEVAGDIITFTGGAGIDTITTAGFLGNLVATGGASADFFNAGNAAATLATSQLTGGAGADTFTIRNTGINVITDLGTGGADILVNTSGTTTATVAANWTSTAASGNAAGPVTLNAAAGVATINVAASAAAHAVGYTINATANTASTLTGSSAADTINGSALADTIRGNAAADTLTGNGGVDTFIFTTAVSADNVTDFSVAAGELTQYSVAAFNAAGGAVAGVSQLVNGNGGAIGAGAAVSLLNVAAASALTAATVINLTGTQFATIAAAEAAIEGGVRALTTLGALAAADEFLVQWQDNAGTFHVSSYYTAAGVGAATALVAADGVLSDVATVGTTALAAANFQFVA